MPTRSGGHNFLDANGLHQIAVTLEDAAGDPVSIGGASSGLLQVNDTGGDPVDVGYDAASTSMPTNIPQLHRDEDSLEAFGSSVTPITVSKAAASTTDVVAGPGVGFQLEILKITTKQVGATSNTVTYKEEDGSDLVAHEMITQGSVDQTTFSPHHWRLTEDKGLQVTCTTTSSTRINVTYRVYTVPA
jgi:hypothetical protein